MRDGWMESGFVILGVGDGVRAAHAWLRPSDQMLRTYGCDARHLELRRYIA